MEVVPRPALPGATFGNPLPARSSQGSVSIEPASRPAGRPGSRFRCNPLSKPELRATVLRVPARPAKPGGRLGNPLPRSLESRKPSFAGPDLPGTAGLIAGATICAASEMLAFCFLLPRW